MRANDVLTIVVLSRSSAAWADAPKLSAPAQAKVTIPLGPSKVIEVEPWEPPARKTTKSPGIDGTDSSGIVIDPGPHADARPYPYGIWIRPPDIGDHNVLELGTDRLATGESSALSARLSRGLDQSVDKLFELILPPPKLLRSR